MKYQKTELGQQALKNRSIPLSPRQRSAFILFDGRRSVADVLQATEGLGVTREDVDYMTGMGLLEQATGVAQSGQPGQVFRAGGQTLLERIRHIVADDDVTHQSESSI